MKKNFILPILLLTCGNAVPADHVHARCMQVSRAFQCKSCYREIVGGVCEHAAGCEFVGDTFYKCDSCDSKFLILEALEAHCQTTGCGEFHYEPLDELAAFAVNMLAYEEGGDVSKGDIASEKGADSDVLSCKECRAKFFGKDALAEHQKMVHEYDDRSGLHESGLSLRALRAIERGSL